MLQLFGTPHTEEKTHKIEMVQRPAARWTTNDKKRTTSVSSFLYRLNWQSLEQRRSVTHLCLFYKIVYRLVALPLPHYIEPVVRLLHIFLLSTDHHPVGRPP